MIPADYLLLGAEMALISVPLYAVVQWGFKPWVYAPLVQRAKNRHALLAIAEAAPDEPTEKDLRLPFWVAERYRSLIRLFALSLGALLGWLFPGWPEWLAPGWSWVLGAGAGVLCSVFYHAIQDGIPALFALLPEVIASRLKGLAGAASFLGTSATQTMDTLDETLPEAGENQYIGDGGE